MRGLKKMLLGDQKRIVEIATAAVKMKEMTFENIFEKANYTVYFVKFNS